MQTLLPFKLPLDINGSQAGVGDLVRSISGRSGNVSAFFRHANMMGNL